jgi:hypothetical protein
MINGNACFAYFNKNWGIPWCPQSCCFTPKLIVDVTEYRFQPTIDDTV